MLSLFGRVVENPSIIPMHNTLKCVSIGTVKTIDIPYIPNGKLMFVGNLVFKRIIIGL